MLELEQCKDYVGGRGGEGRGTELFKRWWCTQRCYTRCRGTQFPHTDHGRVSPWKGPPLSMTGLSDLHSSVYRKLKIGSSFHPHLTHLCNPCGDVLPNVQRASVLKIIARIRRVSLLHSVSL